MEPHSFTQYIKKHYYDTVYDLANDFLKRNRDRIIREKVLHFFDLSDITIKRVNDHDAEGGSIDFDVVIAAEIDAYHENGREDQIEIWLR